MKRYGANTQLRLLLFMALIGIGISWLYNNTDWVEFKREGQLEQRELVTEGQVTINDKAVSVAIADTEKERGEGLMFVEQMGEDEGMLFIFNYEVSASFWMKDTYIPLDMIFISKNYQIVSIQHDVQPCKEDPCPTYPSSKPFMYVVEVNAGWAKENGIEIGDEVEILRSET